VSLRKRFYREVAIQALVLVGKSARDVPGHTVLLDGNAVNTPAGAVLPLPSEALAEAVAAEFRAQGETINPDTMIFTRLVNTAIDRVAPNRQAAIEQILSFAKSDLLCYRAQAPQELVIRQAAVWDPLLEWAQREYHAPLEIAFGIGFVQQPADALAALERALAARDAFTIAGLHAAATLLGSAIIALALCDGRLGADDAFAAAQLDEIYQAEKWGQDPEALLRWSRKANEVTKIAEFFHMIGDRSPSSRGV
jgi:chaperone required for assembly of F1-ATPase